MSTPSASLDTSAIAPGTVIAGKYRVERLLGAGGMGVVVLARHVDLDERVALKLLHRELAQHPEAGPRFLREARAAVKIKSPHVARVLDVGRLEGDVPFMVMEFLQGADLGAVLAERGKLGIEDAVDYVVQAAEALAEAHAAGIVHRDVKPSNLFLTWQPDGRPLVKVLDFGISKILGDGVEILTRSSVIMGSTPYMSPEQMESTRDVDARTDVYALGATLYELLAGRSPFQAVSTPQLCAMVLRGASTPLHDVRPDVAPGLEAVVHKAFALERADRYPSMAAFAAALAPFAPERSLDTLASFRRIGAASIAPEASSRPVTPLGVATTELPAGAGTPPLGIAAGGRLTPAATPITPVTSPGVSKNSAPEVARPGGGRRRVALVASLSLVVGIGAAGLLARVLPQGPPAGQVPTALATAHPSPPGAVASGEASKAPEVTTEGATTTPASAPGTAAAARRVRLVILPADAAVELDGARAEAQGGVLEIVGALGSVHKVRLTKDGAHVEGDVSVSETGAIPAKLEIVAVKAGPPAKAGPPGKAPGKSPRFGFDE